MSRLLLLSHSELSKSFYDTLGLIMGQTNDHVSYIVLPYGQDMDEYQAKIEEEVEKAKDEGILIMTDLFGGSPFMITTRVYEKYHDKVPMEVICGMSLPMIIEAVSAMNQPLPLLEFKELVIKAGHQGIVDFTDRLYQVKTKERSG